MLLTYNQERKQRKPVDSVGWLDLPTELLIEILKYLNPRDILHCQAVCRTLRDIVADCAELQYFIELTADNLVEGFPKHGAPSSAERLRLLLERRRRWRELDWTKKHVVPIPGACQAYEFVGGAFAKSMGFFGHSSLNVTWLPTRNAPARSIFYKDLGVAARDFAIDPSQDMMALVEAGADNAGIKIYIRSISKNEKHPLATDECLSAPSPQIGTCFIQIVHDVVGVFFWLDEPGLLVWNWRSGKLLVSLQYSDLPVGAWDFAFLSNRTYMITSRHRNGSIDLYAFGDHAFDVAPPKHVVKLRLPEIQLGRELTFFSTHTSPFLGAGNTNDVPFSAPQDDRIHVMTLRYGREFFHLFLKNSFLLSLINCPPADAELAWDSWGPANTRFMRHGIQFQWLRYVHGQRVALPHSLPDSEGQMLSVLDFNVRPRRDRESSQDLPAGYDYAVTREPSPIHKGTLFTRDFTTSLPYTRSTRMSPEYYNGFMLDDQCIIGMKESAFVDSGNFEDIDVFTF
ncbi:F-box protein [Phanerochaete sordida]|uniref:F-box protein n=1 Tax=Phanerochaete sordida TaxID=48140 RepID=A0A9P3LMG7_9APHY|nr:F-box protein [Phanerochaete sordida]